MSRPYGWSVWCILAAMLGGTWNMYRHIDRDTYDAFLIASIRHIAKMVRAYGLIL